MYKIFNADVLFREDCTADDLIDIIEVSASLLVSLPGCAVSPRLLVGI
jgi:ribosome-interacting GTPase 1